jgi:hypothetical protein
MIKMVCVWLLCVEHNLFSFQGLRGTLVGRELNSKSWHVVSTGWTTWIPTAICKYREWVCQNLSKELSCTCSVVEYLYVVCVHARACVCKRYIPCAMKLQESRRIATCSLFGLNLDARWRGKGTVTLWLLYSWEGTQYHWFGRWMGCTVGADMFGG